MLAVSSVPWTVACTEPGDWGADTSADTSAGETEATEGSGPAGDTGGPGDPSDSTDDGDSTTAGVSENDGDSTTAGGSEDDGDSTTAGDENAHDVFAGSDSDGAVYDGGYPERWFTHQPPLGGRTEWGTCNDWDYTRLAKHRTPSSPT